MGIDMSVKKINQGDKISIPLTKATVSAVCGKRVWFNNGILFGSCKLDDLCIVNKNVVVLKRTK